MSSQQEQRRIRYAAYLGANSGLRALLPLEVQGHSRIGEALSSGCDVLLVDGSMEDRDWQALRLLDKGQRPYTVVCDPRPELAGARWRERDVDLLIPLELGQEGLDWILSQPLTSARARRNDALVGISLVGGSIGDRLREVSLQLKALFDGDKTFVQVGSRQTGKLLSAVDRLKVEEKAAVYSARTGVPILVPPLVLNEPPLANCFAAFLGDANRPVGIMCLYRYKSIPFARRDAQVVSKLGERLGRELSFVSAHKRVVTELDDLQSTGAYDAVMGMWNAEAFQRLLETLVAIHNRSADPLTILALRVTNLPAINEFYGYKTGDRAIGHLSQHLTTTLRDSDVVGRMSGNQFVCVLPGARAGNATSALRRFRAALAKSPMFVGGESIQLEVAAGAIEAAQGTTASQLIERATEQCDQAARNGHAIDIADGNDVPLPQEERQRPARGSILGGTYRLLHEISSGAVGVVYRAEDLALRRPVAVKVLRPDRASDPQFVAGFREESAILASLRHPNVVDVYASGVDEGNLYFAMELVEGESLAALIDRHTKQETHLPLEQVLQITEQIASAVESLHEAGLVHRDIKPDNILLDPFRSRAVLVDVGIAWRRGTSSQVAGTPGYIAPEAVFENTFGRAADVYGLAVTVYSMLTRDLPWPQSDVPLQLIRSQREVAPTPLSVYRPELRSLDSLLLQGMVSDPDERMHSASEFAQELKEGIERLALPATTPHRRPAMTDSDEASGATLSFEAMEGFEGTETVLGIDNFDGRSDEHTRGIVYRQFARVLSPRKAAAWRTQLSESSPNLAAAIASSVEPLSWLPTELLADLIAQAPEDAPADFAQKLGRAALRATISRFFPASGSTLSPKAMLSAMPMIWRRYHSWGEVEAAMHSSSGVLRFAGTPARREVCAWTEGMLEQLVLLSGGADARIHHPMCEADGQDACVFELEWLERVVEESPGRILGTASASTGVDKR